MEFTMPARKSKGNGKKPKQEVIVPLHLPPRNFHGKKQKYPKGVIPFHSDNDPRIAKGQAGQPRLIHELRELARYYTEDAIFTMYEIMADKHNKSEVRLEAAGMLLDRGWGKPANTTNLNVRDDNIRDLTTAEILQKLAAEGTLGKEGSEDEPSEVH
jgi:hypothetical protein